MRDSAVWVSITPALGIEVARALLTTDSLFLIDKIHDTYWLGDTTQAQTKFGVKPAAALSGRLAGAAHRSRSTENTAATGRTACTRSPVRKDGNSFGPLRILFPVIPCRTTGTCAKKVGADLAKGRTARRDGVQVLDRSRQYARKPCAH
ncbi:MAG: DUF4292 domain-containing protein [Flavobacteriales bacterium]|nr:DUF4292 domain-containing protein [Flavobacteriales bacterium]